MKKLFYFSAGTLVMTLLIFAPLLADYNEEIKTAAAPVLDASFLSDKESGPDLKELERYDDLPVALVKHYRADNEAGQVIYIPQNHRYPGTKVSDPKNDSAQSTQDEIYEVLGYLHERHGIGLVMVEGEQVGPVAPEKITTLSTLIEINGRLKENLARLEEATGGNPAHMLSSARLISGLSSLSAYLDRAISLKGGAQRLAAGNGGVKLVGAEVPGTQAECAEIVRDYIYQKDQLKNCQGPALAGGGALPSLGLSGDLQERLKQFKEQLAPKYENFMDKDKSAAAKPGIGDLSGMIDLKAIALARSGGSQPSLSALSESARGLKSLAEENNDQELAGIIGSLLSDFGVLEGLLAPADNYGQAGAPSRQDNPYSHINDPAELEEMIEESEDKIQSQVIDRRNRETAREFKKALTGHDEERGALVYGAGHEAGLVEALNEEALSVIVVKTDEVLRREQAE
jgi:hypothetical protein